MSIVSIRTARAARAVASASRSFATSSSRLDQPSQSIPARQTSQPPASSPAGFSALRDLFANDTPSTISPFGTSTAPAAQLSVLDSTRPTRGYDPAALPPRIDPVIDLFTNMLMKHGEKEKARTQVQMILQHLRETTNQQPVPLLHRAVLLVSPSVMVHTMRKSLKRIDTPRGLTERQRTHKAIEWILKASETGRKTSPREQRIAREILRILEGESQCFKWLEDQHKTATLARANINAR